MTNIVIDGICFDGYIRGNEIKINCALSEQRSYLIDKIQAREPMPVNFLGIDKVIIPAGIINMIGSDELQFSFNYITHNPSIKREL